MKALARARWGHSCGVTLGVLLLLGAGSAAAATYFVDLVQPDDTGDGLSWATAKKTIQAAITVAPGAPDDIWVKAGTYAETITMKSGVALYGGFVGGETLLTQRNVTANITTINASSPVTPRYHVVTMDTLTNARFDGFSVTGGYANGTAPNNVGGGIYCNNLNNTNVITNFIVSGNGASGGGGGMYCGAGSSPAISNGLFILNIVGGGLQCDASSPTLSVCIFLGNWALLGNGGAIRCSTSGAPAFTNCVMGVNTALTAGGAIWCSGAATPSFTNCVISGNNITSAAAAGTGGAVYCQSNATFTNCLISGNQSAGQAGGGAISVSQCSPTFVNCTIASNVCTNAIGHGGGIACTGSYPILKNTIFENNGQYAVYRPDVSSAPVASYCLFFNNADSDYYDGGVLRNGAVAINGIPGNSFNVDTDPKFTMNGPQAITGTWTAAPTVANSITTLTDDAAHYVPNALFGQLINADTTQRRQAYIISNTATQINVVTDITSYAGLGDTYRIVNYQLDYGSGAIDYGTSAGAPLIDLGSKLRPVDIPWLGADGTGTLFDIGAYEAQQFAPTVHSVVRVNGSPTNADSVQFTVTFSKPVTGVDVTDFALTTTNGMSGASISFVSPDAASATRTVTVNTGAGVGTIRLDVLDDDTIVDTGQPEPPPLAPLPPLPLGGAGLGNGAFTTGEVYNIDKTPPEADTIASITTSPTYQSEIAFSVHFTEPVVNFNDATDVVIAETGVTHTGVTFADGPELYTVTVTGVTGNGSMTLAVNTASDVQDAVTNALASSVISNVVVVDQIAPTAMIGTAPDVGAADAGQSAYFFTVVYEDNLAIAAWSLGDFNVRVTGPSGFDQLADIVSVTPPGSGTPRTANYQITPPGGSWDAAGTGWYTIGLEPNTIYDTAGSPAPSGTLSLFTVDVIVPTATLSSAPNIGSGGSGNTQYQFTVTYEDNTVIDASTLDNADARVTGPNGFDQLAVLVSVAPPGNGTPRTATYQITPPGGSWGGEDTGTYVIQIEADQVRDTFANAVAAGVLGSFDVDVTRPTATVDSLPDVGVASAGLTSYSFTIRYEDVVAIDVNTLDNTDIRVTGPSGFPQAATFVTVTPPGNGTPCIATYQIVASGGSWDTTDTGTYTVALQGGQVANTFGKTVPASVLGRFRVDVVAPTAGSLVAPNVNTLSPPNEYMIEVTYADNSAVTVASLDNADVRVTGPNGFDALAVFRFVNPTGNGTPRTATYRITPPGGAWDSPDDGVYTIALEPNQVFDPLGNPVAPGTLGTFSVDVTPPTATITRADANPTTSDTPRFHVDFSESVGTSFTEADIFLFPGASSGVAAVSGTDPNYIVTVTLANPDSDDTVGIFVQGLGVSDLAGNAFAGAASPVYTVHNWHGFTAEPTNTKLYSGEGHTFRVDADFGPITPTFQWKRDNGPDGPVTQTWRLAGVSPSDGGHYWCAVTYDGVVHESLPHALLTVYDHLQITVPPAGGPVPLDQPFTFTVTTTGGYPPLDYQWKKDGNAIGNGNSYVIPSVGESDLGTYTVEVSDANTDVQIASAEIVAQQPGMPVVGLAGVVLLLGLFGVAGTVGARKK